MTTNLGTPIRRSRSIGNIKEYDSKVERLEQVISDLPSKIRDTLPSLRGALRRTSTGSSGGNRTFENKLEGSGTYPTESVNPKALMVLVLPFFPIFAYSLFYFFSSLYLWAYLSFLLYFVSLVAWLISEIAIRPPWYKPTTPDEGLTQEQIPSYWQGICHDPQYDLHLNYQDVEFKNKSGITLRGWYIPGDPLAQSDKLGHKTVGVVLVHGGGRDRRAFLRHAPIFHKQGYDVLLFDFSEHGTSDGSRKGFTFGIREKEDVKTAVQWMRSEKKHHLIIVEGTSVGASATIMAAAEDPTIDAVIAENPVACAEEFALFHLKRMVASYAPKLAESWALSPFYRLVTSIFLFRIGGLFGYNRPLQVMNKLKPRPFLLMHGTADDLVPFDDSVSLYESVKDVPEDCLWLAKDACHCALFDKYPEEYAHRINYFIDLYVLKKDVTLIKKEEQQDDENSEDESG